MPEARRMRTQTLVDWTQSAERKSRVCVYSLGAKASTKCEPQSADYGSLVGSLF